VRFDRAVDHRQRPVADERPDFKFVHPVETERLEHVVGGLGQVRCGIHKCSVDIEDNRPALHEFPQIDRYLK
jgi:hypothetical protein